ncbi:hypothetical protein [Halostella litorea]|uniref:hypothetical protein n=1 Tax=Halostella litorea TaxID=2528831 RepID=UPI001092427D|nr:hypothetical protein [Halostella litorea]
MNADVSREDLRPSQIQYQLLSALLSIGNAYDSAADAPGEVNEALEHVETAMHLLADDSVTLSEARPDTLSFDGPDGPVSKVSEQDWHDLADAEFVDVAVSELQGDRALVFEHPDHGLVGLRYRSGSQVLEPETYGRRGGDDATE